MHDPTGPSIAASTEVGAHGVMHLRRYWSRTLASLRPSGTPLPHEPDLDAGVLNVLRLAIEPTTRFLLTTRPTFPEFERWVDETSGGLPPPDAIARFNDAVRDGDRPAASPEGPDVLTDEHWQTWREHGYVVVPNALSPEACERTVQLICEHLGVDEHHPASWYGDHGSKQGIMVQLFRHAQLEENRLAPRVRRVFEQLWARSDLLPSYDRVGFNPPETEAYSFPGPELHWDVSLVTPIPFGTQGLIYLRDTEAEQGALTVVPGMQRTLEAWLASLPDPSAARTQDLHALGSRPIPGSAGSLVVWHQALAHGSRPNRTRRPRFVQYVNYQPVRMLVHPEWV